jgi:RNA-splicing ligase RtcB
MTITARETLSKTRKTVAPAREQLADTVDALARKMSVLKTSTRASAGQVSQHLQKGIKMVQDNGGEAPQATKRVDQLTKTVRRHQVSTAAVVLAIAVMLLRLFRNKR